MQLTNLYQRLRQVRSRIRQLFFIEGLLRSFYIFAGAMTVLFLMDYFLSLPTPVRMILFVAVLAYTLKVCFDFIVYPLSRHISDDDIAISVERQFPDLQERLISTLQLSRQLESAGSERVQPNRAMVELLAAETLDLTKDINFQETIKPQDIKKVTGIAVSALLAIVIFALVFSGIFSIFIKRLGAASIDYPAYTQVRLLSPSVLLSAEDEDQLAKKVIVAYGSDISVRVKITGKQRSEVVMYKRVDNRNDSSADWERILMRQSDEDPQQYFIPNTKAVRGFDFYVEAGDGYYPSKQSWSTVAVNYPPRVLNNSINVMYQYPAYTKIPPKADHNRMIKAVVGTVIKLQTESDTAISRAYLNFYDYKQRDKLLRRVDLTVSGSGMNKITGTFKITETARYRLIFEKEIEDSVLDNSHDPLRGSVSAVLDDAPQISLRQPKSNFSIMAKGYIPFDLYAKDDYGVEDIRILCQVKKKGQADPQQQTPYVLTAHVEDDADSENSVTGDMDVSLPAQKVQGQARFQLSDLHLDVGDLVILQVEVADNRDGAANKGYSKEHKFVIVDEDTIREEIAKRLTSLIRRIQASRKQQVDLRNKLERLQKTSAEQKHVFSKQEKLLLNKNKAHQHKLSTEYTSEQAAFDEIVMLYAINGIIDSEQIVMEDFSKAIQELAEIYSPRARDEVLDVTGVTQADQQLTRIGVAIGTQNEIIERLEKILRDLNKYADYNNLIRYTRQLIRLQKAINEKTEKERKKAQAPK